MTWYYLCTLQSERGYPSLPFPEMRAHYSWKSSVSVSCPGQSSIAFGCMIKSGQRASGRCCITCCRWKEKQTQCEEAEMLLFVKNPAFTDEGVLHYNIQFQVETLLYFSILELILWVHCGCFSLGNVQTTMSLYVMLWHGSYILM